MFRKQDRAVCQLQFLLFEANVTKDDNQNKFVKPESDGKLSDNSSFKV